MPLDGITLNSVVKELYVALVDGRVDKIQQPEPDEIILSARSRGVNYKVLFTVNAANPRIHLTEIAKTNPQQAPMFCMLLRKHLGGGRIIDIVQPDFERIVEFYIESPNEMGDMSVKRLVVEIMGKHSNIILLDAAGTIMDSIRHVSINLSSVRPILPGRAYTKPPSQGKVAPTPVDAPYFLSLFNQGGKKAQQLIYQSFNGISPLMASEICLRADVPPDEFLENITAEQQSRLLDVFTNLYQEVANGQYECYIYKNEEDDKREFSAFDLKIFSGYQKSELFASPSKMLETYYQSQDKYYRLKQKTTDLRKLTQNHLDRCNRKAQVHHTSLQDVESREKDKLYGELITAFIHSIPKKANTAKLPNFYDDNNEVEIPLDPTLTAPENAQKYFKRYNKAKRTYTALQEQISSNNEEMAYLQSVIAAIDTITDEEDIEDIRIELAGQGFLKKYQQNKKKSSTKKSVPLHFRSTEGFDIFVGKNNTQNDELTLRFAKATDIWMHTKEIAGSHVIIQTGGKEVTEQVVKEGAMLAAYYSKGRNSSQVPVDYCQRKNVRKPNGAKPGFVIYDFYKTIYVTPENDL